MEELRVLQHMPRNLWRTGGRMNFPLDGLALYLPLWHPELTGTPIISKDLNAYSVTIIGTTKGIQGRLLDAIDDSLTFGDTSTLAWMHGKGNTSAFKWTFLAWLNQLHPGVANAFLLDTMAGGSAQTGVEIFINKTTRIIFVGIVKGSAGNWVVALESTNLYPNSTAFNCLGVTYDQSLASANAKLYLAGAYLESGNKTANAPNNANASYAPLIGRYNPAGSTFDGTIGEMVIIDKILTDREMQHYYDATKWRYQ